MFFEAEPVLLFVRLTCNWQNTENTFYFLLEIQNLAMTWKPELHVTSSTPREMKCLLNCLFYMLL